MRPGRVVPGRLLTGVAGTRVARRRGRREEHLDSITSFSTSRYLLGGVVVFITFADTPNGDCRDDVKREMCGRFCVVGFGNIPAIFEGTGGRDWGGRKMSFCKYVYAYF